MSNENLSQNIKLVIAYLGSSFFGWQKTKVGPTIEETLENTLQTILQHEVKLQAASRTDAGVHAEGQVVNFTTPKSLCLKSLQQRLNFMLPRRISIISIEWAPDDFHPTLSCLKKEYWYHLCYGFAQIPFLRKTSWHFPSSLDLAPMRKASEHLTGTHDFSAFCNERPLWDRSPVCKIEKIEIFPLPMKQLCISITGDHFLYKMARNIAGTLAYVGCGKLTADQIPSILASKDRTQAGITAPAHGLILKRVFY
ncbi:MAG: tRNA pseudouridine(38-40) synthase TruA [Rhabdochlamydiaceae bacterium]